MTPANIGLTVIALTVVVIALAVAISYLAPFIALAVVLWFVCYLISKGGKKPKSEEPQSD